MRITIAGEPVPKARPRLNRRTGTIYTPRTTRTHEDMIALLARATGARFEDKPVVVTIALHQGGKKKLDIDNAIKCILDGINHSGVWIDDNQVVELHAYKFLYAKTPRTEITVEAATDTTTAN